MSWLTPKTWSDEPGLNSVVASNLNTYVRDNFTVLKTQIDDNGALRTALKTFAYGSGQGNTTTGSYQELTSYTVPLPADYVDQPGSGLLIEGLFIVASNANSKFFGIQLGTSMVADCWNDANNYANHHLIFQLLLKRRTQTTGAISGICCQGQTAFPSAALRVRLTHVTLSGGDMDFGLTKNLKILVNAPSAGDLTLTDYHVARVCATSGALV